MKRSAALLLASLMLVFTLTACGRRDNQQDSGSQNNSQNDSAVIDGDNGNGSGENQNNGSTGGTQNPIEEGVDDIRDGIDNTVDDITGQNGSAQDGVTYDQMLRNSRVHDTDGNLNDGENAATPGTTF